MGHPCSSQEYYFASNTSNVKAHIERNHPKLWTEWKECIAGKRNWNNFFDSTLSKGRESSEKASKPGPIDKFLTKALVMPKRVEAELLFVMWASVIGLGKNALNHPLFDLAMEKSGSNLLPNRHTLSDDYVMKLDSFVSAEIRSNLSSQISVSVVWDEWRDSIRRNWLDLCVVYISDTWEIIVTHPEPVFLTDRTSGDILAGLIRGITDRWLGSNCLIATATTDGAAKELLAGETLVNPGNNLWCSAHLAQLALKDVVNSDKLEFGLCFSNVVQKCHDLVVLIRGSSVVLSLFRVHANEKIATDDGQCKWKGLTMDVETRWDSTLSLLERVVFFDTSITALYRNPESSISPSCMLSSEEFDLVRCFIEVLKHFRTFVKLIEYRRKPTTCFLPRLVDDLVENLKKSIDTTWTGVSANVVSKISCLQHSLIGAVKSRFGWVFKGDSLCLGAASFVPSESSLTFLNFIVDDLVRNDVKENLLRDFLSLHKDGESQKNLLECALKAALQFIKEAAPGMVRIVYDFADHL